MLRVLGRLGPGPAEEQGPELNMAPLIDMVFLLLIFFLVTTSFVRPTGVEVNRPKAATAQALKGSVLMVTLTADGRIFLGGRRVGLHSLRGLVEQFLAQNPGGAVVVAADKAARTGRLIAVLDSCRLGGAKKLSVAAIKQ